jgi:hypothetical protein
MEEKICYDCGEKKSLQDFVADRTKADGYRGNCKICYNQKRKKTFEKEIIEKSASAEESSLVKYKKAVEDFGKIYLNLVKSTEMIQSEFFNSEANLKKIESQCIAQLEEIKKACYEYNHPEELPRNKFSILHRYIHEDFQSQNIEVFISVLKSKLQFWLVSEKRKICEPEIQYKGEEYIVYLPEEIKLKNEEIATFLRNNNLASQYI